jgi:hypothetical protein
MMPSRWYNTSSTLPELLAAVSSHGKGKHMGWQSDWLYHLIFSEAAQLWAHAQKEGAGRFGPAPNRFYLQQCADVNWERLFCQPPILRVWAFDGTLPPVFVPTAPPPTPDRTVRGMFFVDGIVHFHITDDRKRVVWNHWLGRRYGRGKVLWIHGQGQDATLNKDPAFGEWVS